MQLEGPSMQFESRIMAFFARLLRGPVTTQESGYKVRGITSLT